MTEDHERALQQRAECSGADGADDSAYLSRRQLVEGAVAAIACVGLFAVPISAHAEGSNSDDAVDESAGSDVDDADGSESEVDASDSEESSEEEELSSILGSSAGLLFFVVLFIIWGIIYSGGGKAEEDQGLNDWYKEHDDDRPWSRRG